MEKNDIMRVETLAVHGGVRKDDTFGAINGPIYMTSNYRIPTDGSPVDWSGTETNIYARNRNVNQWVLQDKLCALTGAEDCVVLASGGYPSAYEKGKPITGLEEAENHGVVYHAGTKRLEDGSYVTSGGRVLCVSSTGRSLRQALRKSYKGIEAIKFEGAFYRKDIGSKDSALVKED